MFTLFFRLFGTEGILSASPAADLATPGIEKNLPQFLTLEECEKLLATVSTRSTNPERDVAIIKLFVSTQIYTHTNPERLRQAVERHPVKK